jgi:hypothetical protein
VNSRRCDIMQPFVPPPVASFEHVSRLLYLAQAVILTSVSRPRPAHAVSASYNYQSLSAAPRASSASPVAMETLSGRPLLAAGPAQRWRRGPTQRAVAPRRPQEVLANRCVHGCCADSPAVCQRGTWAQPESAALTPRLWRKQCVRPRSECRRRRSQPAQLPVRLLPNALELGASVCVWWGVPWLRDRRQGKVAWSVTDWTAGLLS